MTTSGGSSALTGGSTLVSAMQALPSHEKRPLKSSERTKTGVPSLKVSVAGKPDFTNLMRQPASTKNNIKKQQQLEGQTTTGIS